MEQDDVLIALVTALHLSDLDQLQKFHYDGQTEAEECAFKFYEEELEASRTFLQDRRMALSLERAGGEDRAVLDEWEAAEEVARRDREFAIALARGRATPGPDRCSTPTPSSPHPNSGHASPVDHSVFSVTQCLREMMGFSDATPDPAHLVECVICNDRIPLRSAIRVPCKHSHYYDAGCLRDLFVAATRDESLFPPRCDNTPIPLVLARPLLSPAQLEAFRLKSIEFSTLNRLYCSRLTCSEFLGAASTHDKAAKDCPKCGAKTCLACKAPWHGIYGSCGAGNDDEVAELLKNDFQYQRCPGCKTMVELKHGCYHITCACRKEFCYLCAAPWKNCDCAQWDNALLLQEAARRDQILNEGRPAVAPAVAARRVQRVVEALREDHECAHRSWRLRQGGSQCQSCYKHLDRYLLVRLFSILFKFSTDLFVSYKAMQQLCYVGVCEVPKKSSLSQTKWTVELRKAG